MTALVVAILAVVLVCMIATPIPPPIRATGSLGGVTLLGALMLLDYRNTRGGL